METSVPIITRPAGEQIFADAMQYTFSKISGECDPAQTPHSISDAVRRRASSVVSSVSATRVGGATIYLAESVIDTTEDAVEYLLPSPVPQPKPEEETVASKIWRVGIKIIHKFTGDFTPAPEAAAAQSAERSTLENVVSTSYIWMEKTHNNLLKHKPKSKVGKVIISGGVTVFGAALMTMNAAHQIYEKKGTILTGLTDKIKQHIPSKDYIHSIITRTATFGQKSIHDVIAKTVIFTKNYSPVFLQKVSISGLEFWDDISTMLVNEWNRDRSFLSTPLVTEMKEFTSPKESSPAKSDNKTPSFVEQVREVSQYPNQATPTITPTITRKAQVEMKRMTPREKK